MKKLSLLLLTSLFIVGCSNGPKAKESDFKKVLKKTLDEEQICTKIKPKTEGLNILQYEFGDEHINLKYINSDKKKVNKLAQKQLNALVKADIYKKEKEEKIKINDKETEYYMNYSLTNKGSSQFNHNKELCIGTKKLEKINWYSKPTPYEGKIISTVSYSVKYKLDSWAENFLDIGYDDLSDNFKGGEEEKTLFLTNKGWLVQK